LVTIMGLTLRIGQISAWTKRVLRLTTYVAFVVVVLVVLGTRAVRASVETSALDVGAGLIALGDVAGPTYTVRLNGEAMRVASATTNQRSAEVLDRFERECREHSGGLADEFNALPSALKGQLPENMNGSLGLGVIRKEHEGRGVVACLARDGGGGLAALAQALREFSRSGDLAAFGHMRYVAAEQRADGTTHVVSVWSDGSFPAASIFPAEGDAPGTDDPEASVRPPASRRILAANVDGAPFGVRVYDSQATPAAVLGHYDRELAAHGWQPIETVAERLNAGRAYTRRGVDLMLLTEQKADGGALVSVVAMPLR
jgi:hypothetical protein